MNKYIDGTYKTPQNEQRKSNLIPRFRVRCHARAPLPFPFNRRFLVHADGAEADPSLGPSGRSWGRISFTMWGSGMESRRSHNIYARILNLDVIGELVAARMGLYIHFVS